MSKEEMPVWLKRRIKRHLAKGRGDEAAIRLLIKSMHLRHTAKNAASLPDNVIQFPGIPTLRMLELATT
jgi:hypothetical protein